MLVGVAVAREVTVKMADQELHVQEGDKGSHKGASRAEKIRQRSDGRL